MNVLPIIKMMLPTISTEELINFFKAEHNEEYQDLMFEELRQRNFFLDEKNLDLIKG